MRSFSNLDHRSVVCVIPPIDSVMKGTGMYEFGVVVDLGLKEVMLPHRALLVGALQPVTPTPLMTRFRPRHLPRSVVMLRWYRHIDKV